MADAAMVWATDSDGGVLAVDGSLLLPLLVEETLGVDGSAERGESLASSIVVVVVVTLAQLFDSNIRLALFAAVVINGSLGSQCPILRRLR